MHRSKLAVLTAVAVGSCTFADEPDPAKFESLPNNEFKFEVAEEQGTVIGDEQAAEAARIAALEKQLAENGLCPNGYVIKDRFPIAAKDDPIGQEHNIVYRGACK
jgi:hypothetical protein